MPPAGFEKVLAYLRQYEDVWTSLSGAVELLMTRMDKADELGVDFSGSQAVYPIFFEGSSDTFSAVHALPNENFDEAPIYLMDLSGGFDESNEVETSGNFKTWMNAWIKEQTEERRDDDKPVFDSLRLAAAIRDLAQFSDRLVRSGPYVAKDAVEQEHGKSKKSGGGGSDVSSDATQPTKVVLDVTLDMYKMMDSNKDGGPYDNLSKKVKSIIRSAFLQYHFAFRSHHGARVVVRVSWKEKDPPLRGWTGDTASDLKADILENVFGELAPDGWMEGDIDLEDVPNAELGLKHVSMVEVGGNSHASRHGHYDKPNRQGGRQLWSAPPIRLHRRRGGRVLTRASNSTRRTSPRLAEMNVDMYGNWTVVQLKAWLKQHQLSTSGRKTELIDRLVTFKRHPTPAARTTVRPSRASSTRPSRGRTVRAARPKRQTVVPYRDFLGGTYDNLPEGKKYKGAILGKGELDLGMHATDPWHTTVLPVEASKSGQFSLASDDISRVCTVDTRVDIVLGEPLDPTREPVWKTSVGECHKLETLLLQWNSDLSLFDPDAHFMVPQYPSYVTGYGPLQSRRLVPPNDLTKIVSAARQDHKDTKLSTIPEPLRTLLLCPRFVKDVYDLNRRMEQINRLVDNIPESKRDAGLWNRRDLYFFSEMDKIYKAHDLPTSSGYRFYADVPSAQRAIGAHVSCLFLAFFRRHGFRARYSASARQWSWEKASKSSSSCDKRQKWDVCRECIERKIITAASAADSDTDDD